MPAVVCPSCRTRFRAASGQVVACPKCSQPLQVDDAEPAETHRVVVVELPPMVHTACWMTVMTLIFLWAAAGLAAFVFLANYIIRNI